MKSQESPYTIRSVVKALNALEAFADREGAELSLADLTEIIGEHKAVTHRLLHTLHSHGFLDRNPVTKRFSIGPRVFVLGSYYKRHRELEQVVVPLLRRLASKYGHSGYVAVLDGTECLITDTVEGWHPVHTSAKPGERRPLYATAVGKVILASMSDEQVRELLNRLQLVPMTPNTITDVQSLEEDLAVVRHQGYALCHGEMWEGISAVGVPIRSDRGEVIAAVSVSFPSFMVRDSLVADLSREMMELAKTAAPSLAASAVKPRGRREGR